MLVFEKRYFASVLQGERKRSINMTALRASAIDGMERNLASEAYFRRRWEQDQVLNYPCLRVA